jgi:hypothetical protein
MNHIESLVVMRDVGVQVNTQFMDGRQVTRFINQRQIKDILINEALVRWFQCRFYLTIVLRDSDRTVVVFENLLPRLHVLLDCYRQLIEFTNMNAGINGVGINSSAGINGSVGINGIGNNQTLLLGGSSQLSSVTNTTTTTTTKQSVNS